MTVVISKGVAGAMAESVQRVKDAVPVGGEVDRLRAQVQRQMATIRQLRAEISTLKGEETGSGWATMIYNGRPAMTLAQAATANNVPYHRARRYCEKGRWDAEYVQGDTHVPGARKYGKWIVYDDVPGEDEEN